MQTTETVETVKLYLHINKYGPGYDCYTSDMSEFGDVLVAIQEFELVFDIPDDFDEVEAKIGTLEKAKAKINAEAWVKTQNIDEQIQSLLAIEDKTDETA